MADDPMLKSAAKQFDIIEYLVERDGAGVTAVANDLSLPKSTAHSHLQTLTAIGVVVQRETTYYPSLRLLHLGDRIRNGRDAYRNGRQDVDELASDEDVLVNLGFPEDGTIRVAYFDAGDGSTDDDATATPESSAFSATPLRGTSDLGAHADRLGSELPMHATAMGKSVLAALPREDVEAIVDRHGLPALTEHTITDEADLFAELERIRAEGIARDREERRLGIRCFGSAIVPDDDPVAAVSVSEHVDALDQDRTQRLEKKIQTLASVLSVKLAYS